MNSGLRVVPIPVKPPRQLATLRTLSAEAYQPKLFERDLTVKEAERRIAVLKAEIELANSF